MGVVNFFTSQAVVAGTCVILDAGDGGLVADLSIPFALRRTDGGARNAHLQGLVAKTDCRG